MGLPRRCFWMTQGRHACQPVRLLHPLYQRSTYLPSPQLPVGYALQQAALLICRASSDVSLLLTAQPQVSYALKHAALQAAAGAAAKAGSAGSRKRARGANGSPAAAAADESGSDGGAAADVLLEKASPGRWPDFYVLLSC